MRIGIYIQPIIHQKAGIQRFTLDMVEALSRWGKHEYVLLSSQPVEAPFEVRVLPKWTASVRSLSRWIPRTLKRGLEDLDVVLDPTHFGTFGWIKDVPVIRVIHDLAPLSHPRYHRSSTTWGHRFLFRGAINSSAHLMPVSNSTAGALHDRFPRLPNTVINSPGTFITEEDEQRSQIDVPYFLCVGTFEPRKNHKKSLDAFAKLHEKGFPHELVVVGPNGWTTEVEQIIAKHPAKSHIRQLGYVTRKDLANLYRFATALLYPSVVEGFGLPVLEGMVLGCPVITSNNGAMHELSNGTCLEVDVTVSSSIYEAMIKVIKGGTSSIIESQKVRGQAYSWELWVRRFEDLCASSLS